MPLRNQGVGLTGCVVPKYVGDPYHVIDAQWGKDGWRSVADHAARNAITTQRRREGMAVWTQNDGKLWVLDPAPWDGTDADWTEFSGGTGGTVTAVSVVTANGFAGTVATNTTTPEITIKTGVTGLLLGNGTGVTAATGSDIPNIAESQVTGLTSDLATLAAEISAAGTLQTITLTGDVTGSGTGSFVATIAASAVTTAKINAGAVTEAKLTLADVTTGNVSTAAHGFAPKAPNDSTKYLDGTGAYSVPPGTGGSGTVTSASVVTANGVSATVANPTTTPAFTFTLGAITPTSIVASGSITGSNLSGSNTGDQTITLTGAVTGSGTGSFATTLASIATHTILANLTGGSAAPTAATPTEVLDLIGGTQGQVLYRGASAWSALGPGTSGQFLQTAGAAANPSWASLPSAGATMGGVVTTPVTVAQGGTGDTSLTAHGVLIGEGTSPVAVATIGTAGRPLIDQGAGNDPAFASTGIKIGTHFAPETTATPGSTVTFDLSLTDRHKVTLNQATTFALSNPTTDQLFFIKVIQDSTPRAVTWFTTITWFTSTFAEPTLPQTSGKAILLAFRCTGVGTYDGFVVGASGS